MMPEYRPCIVTETIYPCVGTQGLTESKKHNAIFHFWTERHRFYQQPFSGIYTQPNFINLTVAIVEYEDGTIHECSLPQIQFTDGKAEEISKNKKDDWNKLTENMDSYPKMYENVLFKTNDDRIFYGCYGTDLDWSIGIEDGIIKIIKGVIEWRRV